MREVIIDAELVISKDRLHDILYKELDFPEWYGRNLDALYDMLTSCGETRLTITNHEALHRNLGNYGDLILRVFKEASEENPYFKFSVN